MNILKDSVRLLRCCCCGKGTRGYQWWNRDRGYGLCESCAEILSERLDEEEMKSFYGIKGKHYCLEESEA